MKTTTAQDIQQELCERYYIPSTHFSIDSECSQKCPMYNKTTCGDKNKCLRLIDNFCKIQELYELYQKQAEPYESCELFKNFNMSIQNTGIMKEKTTVFVVMTGDTPERAFSQKAFAEQFITTHERDYHTYIQPLELDKADRYFDPEQYEKEENTAKNAFSAYGIQKQDSGKVPPITSYGECTHPNRKCECRKDGKCPDAQMAIQFCRNCSDEDLQKADEFAKALPHALKQIAEEKERVNHPKHYQHPSGVECITVARHHDFNIGNALKYIWRAGLKQEQGISPTDKQIEDLQKAVFYIQDEIKFLKSKQQNNEREEVNNQKDTEKTVRQ